MFRRIRQRRALKRALREEAPRLRRELREVRRAMRVDAQRARADLDRLSSAPPSCPTCGSPLAIKTAQVKGYNGRQFWGCSDWPSCRQPIIELSVYPAAAWRAVKR